MTLAKFVRGASRHSSAALKPDATVEIIILVAASMMETIIIGQIINEQQ